MLLILECDMTQSNTITRIRLNLMRQNNFQIFKEHRSKALANEAQTKDAPHAVHLSFDITDHFVGGASRDRTDDLLLAKQALSQLSYGP